MSTTQASAPAQKEKAYTAPWWQIHAWGLGAIASYFMYEQFYLINNIHTTVFKVSPVIVGIILALPRLVDGILDPILGHWSDNMHSRWGRRRPFLLVSAIVGSILASAMFWMSPDWPQWAKALVLAASAITLFTACGTYDMAFTALGYELSEEYSDRSRIQAIRGVYWSAVSVIGGYVIWMAGSLHTMGDFLFGAPPNNWLGLWATLRPYTLDANGAPDEVLGFRVISGIISLCILVAVLFPLFWSHERYAPPRRKTTVRLWNALKTTLKCRPFVVILVINIAKGAGTLPRNLFFFIGVYYVCAGDKAEYSKVMSGHSAVWAFAFALLLWPLTKPLTKYIGKRAAFIGGAGLALLQAIGTPFVATPGHVYYWFLFNLFFLPINHMLTTAAAGIMPDICDLDELEHGERREGLFTAVQAFVNKMEISVMTLLTGVFISWTGFDASLGAQQSTQVLDRMRVMAFGPLIAISALAFVVSCFMPLTAKKMEMVRAQLDARRAAAKASA